METFFPHPSRILIGNLGTIKSRFGRPYSPHRSRNGYLRVGVMLEGKTRTTYVHRLVAQAHVPNPRNLPEVNHIDHDKLNNRADNLEWVSHADNLAKARSFHGNWIASGAASPVAKGVLASPVREGPPIWWPSARYWADVIRRKNAPCNVSAVLRTGGIAYGHRWTFASECPATALNGTTPEGQEAARLRDAEWQSDQAALYPWRKLKPTA